jgi:hypothetical protein
LTSQQTFLRKVIFDFQFGVQYQETASVHGVMVFVLASSVVDRGFELWLYQTRDYYFGIRCFSAKHAVLRSKNKDGLARYQGKAVEWRTYVSELEL